MGPSSCGGRTGVVGSGVWREEWVTGLRPWKGPSPWGPSSLPLLPGHPERSVLSTVLFCLDALLHPGPRALESPDQGLNLWSCEPK